MAVPLSLLDPGEVGVGSFLGTTERAQRFAQPPPAVSFILAQERYVRSSATASSYLRARSNSFA